MDLFRVYNTTRYLLSFGDENYDFIYNRIRYLERVKIGITYVFSHNYAKIKFDSYDFMPLEKRIKITTAVIYSSRKVRINQPKILTINKFFYKL